ncbi:MAG: radical SAM protein [Candidatus Omnitrophica bacterium]|nr:radical SAM protein [Candidatus Omnitrophota bacterium]
MKTVFVFSPFASFSYIPLGIAYLKGFVEKNMPAIEVKNIDLSNEFYHHLEDSDFLSGLRGLCCFCPHAHSSSCEGILCLKNNAKLKKLHIVSASLSIASCRPGISLPNMGNLISEFFILSKELTECLNSILRERLERNVQGDDKAVNKILLHGDILRIIAEKPDLLGFSIFTSEQLYYSLALAKAIKRRFPTKIVFGGAYFAHINRKQFLKLCNYIDFVVYKEGELGVVSLLRAIKTGRFTDVPNIVYRDRGVNIESRERLIKDLDSIPFPDFTDFNLKRYFLPIPVVSTLFSRGCYWRRCSFCAHYRTYGTQYRTRSIKNLVRELKGYTKLGVKYICFADEIISAKDMAAISRELIKSRISIFYAVMLKPENDFTAELLRNMYRSGCRFIFWGVESFQQRVLDEMGKGTFVKDIFRILSDSSQVGLKNMILLIQGFPTQSYESQLSDARALYKALPFVHGIGNHRFWLEEGTDIFNNPRKYNIDRIRHRSILSTHQGKLFSPDLTYALRHKYRPASTPRKPGSRFLFRKNTWKNYFTYTMEYTMLRIANV